MKAGASLDILIAQLQIQMERLEALLVTSSHREDNAVAVAQRIVSGLCAREVVTTLYVPATPPGAAASKPGSSGSHDATANPDNETKTFTPAQVGTPSLARALFASPGRVTVVAAPGVLEDPTALFLASAADAVLLVVEARQTTRADLRRARLEIETAGGKLVGAVLHE
jgi:hypothetical protein